MTRGQRLAEKRQYAQAARQYAVAYIFENQPEALIEVARACRKADMGEVAQAIFQRLRDELPQSRYQSEIDAELKSLNYILEDISLNLTQTLRYHLDAAKHEFQAGHFANAVLEYALAYSIKPLPRLVFNTAQAYRRDNQAEEAYILYSNFLKEEPESPVRKEALGYLKELRGAAFPPPLYKRPLFWIPLVSGAVAAAAIALGVGLGTSSQQPSKPVVMFDFP